MRQRDKGQPVGVRNGMHDAESVERRESRLSACRVALPIGFVLMAIATSGAIGAAPAEPAFRYRATIEVRGSASFADLALPPSVYARAQQPGLRDLRVVDANGERVPFALPASRTRVDAAEQLRAVTLYPLPAQASAGGTWDAPVDVVVQGDSVRVTRHAGTRSGGALSAAAAHASAGWLFDLGERKNAEPMPDALQLQWSGPAEFNIGYRLETSADLRQWAPAEGGQLMALASPGGALTQPLVPLPSPTSSNSARFVRLFWLDAQSAPVVTGASARVSQRTQVALDAPSTLRFATSPEPLSSKRDADPLAAHALHFDLGGTLPLQQIELQLERGSRVMPARVQGRERLDGPWQDLGATVFYRVEHANAVSRAPPWAVQANVRFLRIVVDERAGLPDQKATSLVATVQLAHVVFVLQGQPPYALLAGAKDANEGALPITTLVPNLDEERARFAPAALGEWQEVTAVAQQAAADERSAARRPWLLWAVLLVGVLVLGAMVWRLAGARGSNTEPVD